MRTIWIIVMSICVMTAWSCKEKKVVTDEIVLQLRLKEGQSYLTEMSVSQSMEADINGVFSLIDQEIEFQILSDVLKDSSNLFKISNQYQSIKLNQTQSNDDSEDVLYIHTDEKLEDYSSELEKYYYQLIQQSFLTFMDKNGQEVSSGLAVMNKRIGGEKFTSPFQKMFQYGVFFPDYALSEKEVWHKEISIKDDQIVVTGNTRFQLETWDDESIYIQIRSNLKGRHVGFDVGGQIDVEKSGKIVLYRSTGWIKEAAIEQSVKWLDANGNENRLLGQINITCTEN